MLKPEQARGEIEKVRLKNGEKRRVAALAKLPKKIADLGLALVSKGRRGKGDNGPPDHRADWAALARLDELAPKHRRALFEALCPQVGQLVDVAWDLAQTLPYETGFERKAFRAANDRDITRAARFLWLKELLDELEGCEQDVAWLANHADGLSHGNSAEAAGVLFAAAINAGGREGNAVYDTVREAARDSLLSGRLGRHVPRALLITSRPECWDFAGKFLLAGQDQEGIFQIILETINEAHPEAFRRMLQVMLENHLTRYPAVVRALNVWFGFQWDAISPRVVNSVLERVCRFLHEPQAQAHALENDDAETVYLALWTMAFEDAPGAVEAAGALLSDPNVERRFIAAYLLGQLQIPAARARLLAAVDDADPRVALCALEGREAEGEDISPKNDLFERLEGLLGRLPAQKTHLGALVWPWHVFAADREAIAGTLFNHLGKRSPKALIPHLGSMDSSGRRQFISLLAGQKKLDGPTRAALLELAGDPSITVREAALEALRQSDLNVHEIVALENLLSRKQADLRRGVLGLLLEQKNPDVLDSADRLLESAELLERLGGLELLKEMVNAGRARTECRGRVTAYTEAHNPLSEEEQKLVKGMRGGDKKSLKRVPPKVAARPGRK